MPQRPMNREQALLMPPTFDEAVDEDDPARYVADFVDSLTRDNWAELGIEIDGNRIGAPSYHPRMLLSAWLYGFMMGVRSSRQLEAACRKDIPLVWLTAHQRPDHVTLWRFYSKHRESMRLLLKRTVKTAMKSDKVYLALQAVDGTKVDANASSSRSYDADGLRRLLRRLEKQIDELESQNESGEESPPVKPPQKRESRIAQRDRVREALREVIEEEKEEKKAKLNLTDEDARFMKTRQGFRPSYNAQAVVSPVDDGEGLTGMLITAVDVVDEPNDTSQLNPMIDKAEETTGEKAGLTLADAGYHSGKALDECERRQRVVAMPENQRKALKNPYHKSHFSYDEDSDAYECPEGQWLRFTRIKQTRGVPMRLYRSTGAVCRACPAFGVCTRDGRHGRAIEVGPYDGALSRHRAWMDTEEAIESYSQRKHIVEPVFGIMKEQQGARRFLLRGKAKVIAEWTLLATAFNLRTLWRLWRAALRRDKGSGASIGRNDGLWTAVNPTV